MSPARLANRVPNPQSLTHEGVIIDIGTGDGRFAYESARQNSDRFYIGIDANVRPLEKISEKIHRKPAKGGTPNVLFVQSSVEDLPSELNGIAYEVHIHFPWGSLLGAVATGELTVLQNLRRICAPDALLEVVVGLDMSRDQTEIARLGINGSSLGFVDETIVTRYRLAGFETIERGVLPKSDWPELKTSWARRLRGSSNRQMTYILARAC